MTLFEWIQDHEKLTKEFAADWQANSKENPKDWPLELEAEDWDEHFFLWIGA